jgi:5-methylcytosine-specific restriction endonuclease McrA
MARALVLNASYEPLCVVPVRRAVVLVLKQKAEIISAQAEGALRSERTVFVAPSVIRLVQFVKVPFRTAVPLNRRAVFARDGNRCQYCFATAENIDHVYPRSRGGLHVWENVVAACRACNTRKGDKLLENSGMHLRKRPVAPQAYTWMLVAVGSVRADWAPFLGMTGSDLELSALSA